MDQIGLLSLENCGITDKGALAIAKDKAGIRILNVKKNPIGQEGIAALKATFDFNLLIDE